MIGAQQNSLFSVNKIILIFLFALVGFVLGSCGQYKDDQVPDSVEGDTEVRKQYLDSLQANGLAQQGEVTFRTRNYNNFKFNGCALLSEQIQHQIESVSDTQIRIAQRYGSPTFQADRNSNGQSCETFYNQFRKDETLVLDTARETLFRRSFVDNGCEWIQKQLGKSLPDVEMKNCKVTFSREDDFANEAVGSAYLEASFEDSNAQFPISQRFQFFLDRLLWVDDFENNGTGFVTDSEGDRAEYSYKENLSGISTKENLSLTLNSAQERNFSSEELLLKQLREQLN
ncbi:hypothetical protein GW915_03185 [bacterium]|nr:hypothetical protein [bacterium]